MKEKEIAPVGDERVIAYRSYIIDDIISRPEERWQTQARIHYLAVRDHINETFETGPWLDGMIGLKDELARMGKVEGKGKI